MPHLRDEYEGFFRSGLRRADSPGWEHYSSVTCTRGLPVIVDAVPPGDGPRPIELVARQWNALAQCTSIRGIDIEWHYADEFDKFLTSTVTGDLRWLAFENRPRDGVPGPLDALVRSSHSAFLERLEIKGNLTDAEIQLLADADFSRLRHLQLPSLKRASGPLDALVQAAWFRQIRQLDLEFYETPKEHPNLIRDLAGMPPTAFALDLPS